MISKRWYTIEPYSVEALIVVSDEGKGGITKVEKYLKCDFADQVADSCIFFLNVFNPETGRTLRVVIHVTPDAEPDEIAHECVHASWKILTQVGVEITDENNEAQAYLVGHLIRLVNKTIAQYEKKQNKDKST